MPEVSCFLGITIFMNFKEHNPPHFHASYNGVTGIFQISPLKYSDGKLPPRIVGLVTEWAALHEEELLDNWNNLQETGKYKKINPLV